MPTPVYRRIPLDTLRIDPRYQRNTDEGRVNRMSKCIRDELIGTLVISDRGRRGNFVIDGQQRAEALRRAGRRDAPCIVHVGLTPESEAKIFRLLQTERKRLSPLDLFRAGLFAGLEPEMTINATCEAHGFKIKSTDQFDCIQAVVALKSIYKRGGPELLDWTLRLAREAWQPVEERALQGMILEGVAIFLIDTAGKLDERRLKRLLQLNPPIVLRQKAISTMALVGATSGGSGSRAGYVAAEILKLYNKRLQAGRLSLLTE